MELFQLLDYEIRNYSQNQLLVLIRGSQQYKTLLGSVIPDKTMSRTFPDNQNQYDWGAFIHNTNASDQVIVAGFLELMKTVVFVADDLDQCFALSYHTTSGKRTEIGQLINESKPYTKPMQRKYKSNALLLTHHYIQFIKRHARYQNLDMVLSIPALVGKGFDLPLFISQEIAKQAKIFDGNKILEKIRTTKPIKDCKTAEEKLQNLQNAFSVKYPEQIQGKNILVIDDIYQSGFTMHEVSSTLRTCGAKGIYGLVATKASWS
jgi:phosphoribosylpyrophosphate synthetase